MAGGCELQISESLYCECRRQPYLKTNLQKDYNTKVPTPGTFMQTFIRCRHKSALTRRVYTNTLPNAIPAHGHDPVTAVAVMEILAVACGRPVCGLRRISFIFQTEYYHVPLLIYLSCRTIVT